MALSTCAGGNFRVRCQRASSLLSACVSPASWCCSEALDCTSLRPVAPAQIYGPQSPKFTRPAGLADAPSRLRCTARCRAAPDFRPQLKLQRKPRLNRERYGTMIIIIIYNHQRAAVTFTRRRTSSHVFVKVFMSPSLLLSLAGCAQDEAE